MWAYKTTPPLTIFDENSIFLHLCNNLLSSKFWLSPPPFMFSDVSCWSCFGCMCEPAYLHVPYACQATLWIVHLIRKYFALLQIFSDVECPWRSPQLRNSNMISSSNKLCASKMTMMFAGLPLTCVEVVVHGCRCWKGTNYSWKTYEIQWS